MATTQNKQLNVSTGKRTKIETTYEYVPILGNILGYWRTTFVRRMGDKIELHLQTPLEEYDVITVNGREIKFEYVDSPK